MNRIKKLSLLIVFLLIIAGILTACSNTAGMVKISFTVDGEIYREYNLDYGTGIVHIPEVPAKNGYIGAWSVEDFTEFYKDTTVTAVYTKNFFTVTFKADNFIVRTTNVTLGENPSSLPDIPEKEGYEGEWEITDFTSLTVDTIVRAVYTPIKLALKFKAEGYEDQVILVDYGTDLSDIPQVPMKRNNEGVEEEGFEGFWDVENFTDIKQSFTINALYSRKEITINYKHSGIKDDSSHEFTKTYDQHLPLPSEVGDIEGYIFNGWYFDAEFQKSVTNYSSQISKIIKEIYNNDDIDDINIYAYWIEINNSTATDIAKFEFEEIEDVIQIAPAAEAILPSEIILPNSYNGKLVTKIAAGAFEDFVNLESIEIPVGVVEIGTNAFKGCSNLAEVTFADYNRLNTIGDYAFYQTSLKSIDLAKDIKEIGNYAFYECASLKDLDIPLASNLETIGNYAFANSSGIYTINISEKILSIGDYAFSSLNNTVLNFEGLENLKSVGKFAFRNCLGLTTFNAPGIISIGEGAFAGCTYLSDLTVPADWSIANYFGQDSFQNSYEVSQISRLRDFNGEFIVDELTTIQRWLPIALKTIRIQEGVKNVADYVLNNCVAINNIYVPSSVKTIGVLAFAVEDDDSNNLMRQGEVVFSDNTQQEEVVFSDNSGLVEIGDKAFYGRTSINEIVLPSSLESIGNEAFRTASNLSNIVLTDSDNLEFIGSYAFLNTNWYNSYSQDIVYLGNIAIGFKGTSPSDINIASGTKAIAPYAFAENNRILSVEIPSSVEIINEYAFYNCINLKSVVILEEIKEIEEVKVLKGVGTIMDNAFADCVALKTINIPKSVETIGRYILKGSYSIETMEVYGDRTLGDFFGNDDNEALYQINQIQLSYKNCDIVADEEDENKFYITWEESKNLYGAYPAKYNIIITNSIDTGKNIVKPFVLGTFTHNISDNLYYEIDDDGKYIFSITITRSEVSDGIYGYVVKGLGDTFYTEKPTDEQTLDIGDFITIESRFENEYSIPQSLRKIVFMNDDDAQNRVIKPYSFMNLESLEEVVFAEGIKEIGKGAFLNCISLGSKYIEGNYIAVPIALPYSLEIIAESAFENTQKLRDIVHSSRTNLKIIGKRAFADSGLLSFNVPSTVDLIDEQAFINNVNLFHLTFDNPDVIIQLEQILNGLIIAGHAFDSCSSLLNVVFPDRLTAIGDYAFSNNVTLDSVSFSEESQLVEMGEKAFAHCISMDLIILPPLLNLDTIIDILYDCGGLREITLYNTEDEDCHSATLGMLFGTSSYANSYSAVQNGTIYYIPNNLTIINFIGRIYDEIEEEESDEVGDEEESDEIRGVRVSDYTFQNIKSLKIVNLENIKEIGKYAFNNCTGIEKIDLPDTVISIGEYSFENCENMASFNLGEESMLKEIGAYAFRNNISLTSFNFGEESMLSEIGAYAFMNNISLKSFYFPEGITVIESNTFNNCIELENVDIQNITKIKDYAFYNCYSINKLDFSEKIEAISNYAFYNCSNAKIPYKKFDSLTSIGDYAFYNCLGLRYIHAENIETTGSLAYSGAYNLEELSLPENIVLGSVFDVQTYDNSYSVEQNGLCYFVPNKLKRIRVSTKASSLSAQAFKDCVSLSDIIFLSDQPPTLGDLVIENTSVDLKLFIPYDKKGLYEAAYNDYADRIYTNPSDISGFEFIENEDGYTLNTITAFSDTVLYIPAYYNDNPVTKIAPNAFKNNTTITEVIIPNTITEIATSAFEGCQNLKRIIFESGSTLTTIANRAFAYCDSLISIRIPQSVETIGDYAFVGQRLLNQFNEYDYTSNLTEVIFEENSNLTNIGNSAFYLCDKLTTIILPQSVQTIGKAAFRNSGLESIYIPEYSLVNTIAEETFYGCENLQTIALPFYIQSIEKNAFSGCFSLTEISFNQNLQTIAERAFYGCYGIETMTLSAKFVLGLYFGSNQYAGSYAAQQDGTTYYIPSSLRTLNIYGTEIVEYAFANCSSITNINIGASVNEINIAAFDGCNSLSNITVDENNDYFSSIDGVLYNKAGDTLIFAPPAHN